MNRLMRKLLNYCEVAVIYNPLMSTGYNKDNKTIEINPITTHPSLGLLRWALCDRPVHKDFVLAHEIGHAFFEKKKLAKSKKARELFGDFDQEYHGTEGLCLASWTSMRDGYVTIYAKSHPEEDFCECFALLVINDNEIPSYVEDKTLQKMKFIQSKISAAL